MSQWWTAVAPATVEIACRDAQHRITWRRGKLVLEDHDLGAEESFAALGGEPALCLEVLRAWRAAVDDHTVLWFWDTPRIGDPDMAAMLEHVRAQQQQVVNIHRRMVASGGRASMAQGGPIPPEILSRMRAQQAAEHRRSLVSALPEELRMRLGFSAIVRAGRRQHDHNWFALRAGDLETALAARGAPAVEACMRAWRGRLATHHIVRVEILIAGPGRSANLTGLMDDSGARATVWLPILWLVDVWARGVAVVDGCFVLEVHSAEETGDRFEVSALRWERSLRARSVPVVEPAVVVRVDDGWRLRWEG